MRPTNKIQWEHKVSTQGLSTERENWLHPLVPVYLPHISTPGRGQLPSVFFVPYTLNILTNEYLVVMAEGPSNIKEEYTMSTSEDLGTENIEQSQEQPVTPEMMGCVSWSLGGIQRRARAEQKPAGSGLGQSFWNVTGPRPMKGGHQVQMPWMPRDHNPGDAHLQELPGNFQAGRFPYECQEADIVAEIGLEELNGLEMEVMRRQVLKDGTSPERNTDINT